MKYEDEKTMVTLFSHVMDGLSAIQNLTSKMTNKDFQIKQTWLLIEAANAMMQFAANMRDTHVKK